MKEILEKLYPYSAKKAVDDIMNVYNNKKYLIANFIYFAVIKQQDLFNEKKRTTEQKEYKKFIMDWDFLFPDGIALQTFYKIASKRFPLPTDSLWNLNWTDFVPYFLNEIKKRYWSQRIRICLYWSKPEIVNECEKLMKYKWFNVFYAQDGYSDFDWKSFEKQESVDNPINIMLIARWTPTQELWVKRNISKIKSNHIAIFTVWWLFDFIAAWNEEIKWTQKRAPKFVRKMKLERLWRLITDPKRNYSKVKNSLAIFPYIFRYLVLKKE